eukprot:COSAG01_NODE_1683_length_9497_cov_33.408172_15_plen_102_part_00
MCGGAGGGQVMLLLCDLLRGQAPSSKRADHEEAVPRPLAEMKEAFDWAYAQVTLHQVIHSTQQITNTRARRPPLPGMLRSSMASSSWPRAQPTRWSLPRRS